MLFSKCADLHHFSSSVPRSRNRACPVIVVEMDERALVFRLRSKEAREERVAAGGGEPERCGCWGWKLRVGGRWETQSWTRRETLGLERRLRVFRDNGFVVIIMVGPEEEGVEVKGVP